MTLTVRVPASTSNLGAGFDCLGLALDVWLEARLLEGSGPARYTGTVSSVDPDQDHVASLLRASGVDTDRRLELHSEIPIGKGLGSSAAALTAGAALVQLAEGRAVDHDAIFETVAQLEGHPDNAGPAIYGGLVLSADLPTRLALHAELGVGLAIPEEGIDTHEARALLPREVPRAVAIAQSSRAAALLLGLTNGESQLIRFGMEDQLAVTYRKRLIRGFDTAVRAGLDAGAHGVTISGAGSALIALAPRLETGRVAAAIAEALTREGNPARSLAPAVSASGLTVT